MKQLITYNLLKYLKHGKLKNNNTIKDKKISKKSCNMFKLPIPTRLTDYLGEAMSEPL